MKELYEINEEAYPFKNGNAYAYDMLGNRIAITDALGNTIFRSYDPFGNIISEWGATYPVRYTYDTQGRRTSLSTTRDGVTWDVTSWTYNPHTGLCAAKTYADGSQIQYTYTPDGLTLRTTYASGRWMENVYNAKREVIETLSSGGDEDVTYAKDEFGRITFEESDSVTVVYSLAETDVATNELWTVGDSTAAVVRALDDCGRFSFNNGMHFSYSGDGKLLCLSNEIAKVEYQYSSDRLDVGYSIELANGRTFTRNTVRDTYRRGLLMNISSAMNGSQLDGFSYAYDALNRPLVRNSDAFGYNERSEVTDAVVSGLAAEYGYDEIGNSTSYTANSLNQYTQFQYDQDGNLLSDGIYSFTYDSSSRLKTVVSNGVSLVTNYYDAKSRRVRKVTPEATTVFIYDDWNLIEERVAYVTGTASTIKYYWGKDLSGELQGAGGVGGLLYFTVDDAIYIPCYDNNGNVTKYIDSNGNIVASYTYDAFGKLIAKSGPLADFFRHRFSTKYFDAETALYYYGYRFYHPSLMRWLNRDPIEENGGFNLYGFCGNNIYSGYDKLGLYRWVAIYYSRLDQAEFKRAAETYKRQIEKMTSFNPKCDKVIIKGALSNNDFSKVWREVLNETNKDGAQYKIKALHIFSHSGRGMLFFRGGSMSSDEIQKLPRLNWASDGSVVNHGCNSGLHDEDGNSVAKSFAKGQGVLSKGQTGFSQFSENPQKRTWFTRVDAGSNDVYLWSFGDGGPKWTFGAARPTNDERP